jgi:hypothetical protein
VSDQFSISMGGVADVVRASVQWPDFPNRAAWEDMFDSLADLSITGRLTDREYLVELYRRRLEHAGPSDQDSLDGLRRALESLGSSTEPQLCFIISTWQGHGYFIWLDRQATSLVAYWRAVDARGRT